MKTTLAHFSFIALFATLVAANPLSLWGSSELESRHHVPTYVNFTLHYSNETKAGYPFTIDDFPVDGKTVKIDWSTSALVPNVTSIKWTNFDEVYCSFGGENYGGKHKKTTCKVSGNSTVFTPPLAITEALCCKGPCGRFFHSKHCDIL